MTVVAILGVIVVSAVLGVARKLFAKLAPGATAPPFRAEAALGDRVFTFDLREALTRGPVVLFFFPRAFTAGCTAEAKLFSDHILEFERLGATVLGISGDDIETQRRFSTQACRSAVALAADPKVQIAKLYDAALIGDFANRTSYVIARDGKIAAAYANPLAEKHITRSLEALRTLVSTGHK